MSGPIAPRANVSAEPSSQASEMLIPESEAVGGKLDHVRRRQPRAEVKDLGWVEVIRRGPVGFLFTKLFLLVVFLPTAAAVWYFGFVASDIYISESRFVVRAPQRSQQPGVLGALLQGTGFQRSQDDSFTVHDFITSRDALKALDQKLGFKASFSSQDIDFLSRFPQPWMDDSFEWLFKYYSNQVSVKYDATSSITTLTVRAFNPQVARDVNAVLLGMGEGLVNQINDRARVDLVKYAETEVTDSETKAKAAAQALARYRNQRAVFDPERQSALQLQQVIKLQDELVATRMQLNQLRSLSPANPQIPTLERRVTGLEGAVAAEMGKVAGAGRDTAGSLTDKAAEFERLQLEKTFAERQVASAMASLESAKSEARRKQLYLERIVQPNLPDLGIEPRRGRAIAATFIFGMALWGVLSMLLAGVKEHRD